MLQVIENPIVEFAGGQQVARIAYEAHALEAMRGRPGIVQLCSGCHGPADSTQQGATWPQSKQAQPPCMSGQRSL